MNELEIEHRLTKVEEACGMIPDMSAKLAELSQQFAKYEGKWGILTLVGAALWAVFAVFKDNIMAWFKG